PIIVCGKGNNGGDGIAAARHLIAEGIAARVVLLAPRASLTGPAASHRLRAEQSGVTIEEAATEEALEAVVPALGEAGAVVDAVLATGLKGPARGLPARAISALNACGAPIVSIDVPSGLS